MNSNSSILKTFNFYPLKAEGSDLNESSARAGEQMLDSCYLKESRRKVRNARRRDIRRNRGIEKYRRAV